MSKKKVLLIGWDAADWKVIHPLMDGGKMPNLQSMIKRGVMGNLATLDPPYSPILWTSIATGKRPYKHGILGFSEVDSEGTSVRPSHITSRKVHAIWNILSHEGFQTHQVGWWPSHPAEPINGISISNFFQRSSLPITEPWPLPEGCVHPPEMTDLFKALRVHYQELTGAHLLPFLPKGKEMDQQNPSIQGAITSISRILADCSSIHSAATYILDTQEWDFMAVYYDAIDHFCHGFMKYHPPRRPHIPEKEYEFYKEVVTAGYRFHDMMLGTLLNLAGEDTMVVLISDHGFYPNHLRPVTIPREPAGPAWEHSPYGIIVATGPGIKKDALVFGASLLDITPTILTYLDLPIGKDMDGKVLNTLFESRPTVKAIDSWENVPGNFYRHPSEIQEDPESAQAALDQLVALGYIEPLGLDQEANVKRTLKETQFNLARSYIDAGKYSEAIPILEELHREFPTIQYYSYRLANAYLQLKKTTRARYVVQTIRKQHEVPSITLLILQARVCLQENELEKAYKYVQDALEINNEHPGLYYYLGECHYFLGKFTDAEEAYLQALKQDPENQQALHSLGRLLIRLERYEEAAEALFTSLGLMYFAPKVHQDLAKALIGLKEFEAASNALQTSLHMMPGNIQARKDLLSLYRNELNRPKMAAIIEASLPDYTLPEMIVVSGLPRSGTSMIMQMLDAGGLEIFTDNVRKADEHNPKGYYEVERIKNLASNIKVLEEVGQRVVKIVAPLLLHLPRNYKYKIIFVERELGEVLLSQHTMLNKQASEKRKTTFSFRLWKRYEEILEKVKKTYRNQKNAEFLFIKHAEVIENPKFAAIEMQEFLGKQLNIEAMTSVVDPALYREREKNVKLKM
ncbi:MAG TPA: alkaline phosphatase family protein [Saprospiraceae bacterium]|nr:alkaline phosphatase family protein [Saprospiraceae bacterium]